MAHRLGWPIRRFAALSTGLVVVLATIVVFAGPASAAVVTAYVGASNGDVDANNFYPGVITVVAGDTVTWQWEGFHTVTFGTPPSDPFAPTGNGTYDGTPGDQESSGAQGGGTYSLIMSAAGNYSYVCLLHPGMQGLVKVLSAGPAPTQAQLDAAAQSERAADLTAGEHAKNGFQTTTTGKPNHATQYNLAAGTAPPQVVDAQIGAPGVTVSEADATLTVTGNTLHVVIDATGLPAGSHAVHIHSGQCATPVPASGADTLFTLNPLVAGAPGTATSVTDVTLPDPPVIPAHGWWIEVHNTGGSPLICGDVLPHRASALRFLADPVTVAVGDTVSWTSGDPQEIHTVTFGEDPADPFTPGYGGSVHTGSGNYNSGILNPGQSYALTFTKPGTYPYFCALHDVSGMVGTIVVKPVKGYWLGASDGGVFALGNAAFQGSKGGVKIPAPIAGIAATTDQHGYWLAGRDGSVYPFGSAGSFGSLLSPPSSPVVGIAPMPDQSGYWLAGSDGGVFAFGGARFFGSMGGQHLNKPVVGIAAAPDGKGYWLVASDGGIFGFGSAKFFGSMGGSHINKPMVGITATPDGKGYWTVASDGGIFSFGTAKFLGSTGSLVLNQPVVGMAGTSDGNGYWLVASDGGIFNYGTAAFMGSLGGTPLLAPIVGMAAAA